jgi:copper chaperone NosL
MRNIRFPILLFLIFTLCIVPAFGADLHFVKPSPKDKCAVCGMFVTKFPDWTAEIIYRDGTYSVFDGPKDMFKYMNDMKTYAPGRHQADIAVLYVTDYYAVSPIDGFKAFYVTGSNVYGPMGPEFIVFQHEADARVFMQDHKGKRMLRFRDITPEIIREME